MSAVARTMVLGLGVTGMSCVRFLHGATRLTVCDTRITDLDSPLARDVADTFADVDVALPDAFATALTDADLLVVSPGVPLSHCLVAEARKHSVEIAGDIDLFMQAQPGPVVGITGTNGKSTVTTLVGMMLEEQNVGVGGNLGTPALDLLADERDGFVLELSSFQLERTAPCHFEVASVLNVSDDHLDRYDSFEAYVGAKQRIYRDCSHAVFNGRDANTVPEGAPATSGIAVDRDPDFRVHDDGVVIGGEHIASDDIGIAGKHNHFNAVAAAAMATCRGVARDTVRRCLREFGGLPHRTEVVARRQGITYVNDSKATNVGSCVAALHGLGDAERPNIVLIAGGEGKGADFEPLAAAVARVAKHTVLIGRDAPLIEQALAGLPTSIAPDLEAAVDAATGIAASGDLVLLSPACASFDMFDNFEQRGNAFARLCRGEA